VVSSLALVPINLEELQTPHDDLPLASSTVIHETQDVFEHVQAFVIYKLWFPLQQSPKEDHNSGPTILDAILCAPIVVDVDESSINHITHCNVCYSHVPICKYDHLILGPLQMKFKLL